MSEVIRNQRIHELADLLDETCQRMAETYQFTLFSSDVSQSTERIIEIQDTTRPLINFLLADVRGVRLPLESERGSKVGDIILASWVGIDISNLAFHHWIAHVPEAGNRAINMQTTKLHLGETLQDMRKIYPIA